MTATPTAQAAAPTTSQPQTLHSPTLIPSILPRITHIAELLQTVGRESGGASKGASASADPQPTQSSEAHTQTHQSSTHPHIPSIALGATSDDDGALYDFLHSHSGGESGTSTVPHHLTLELVREAKALRETYAEVERCIASEELFREGEWACDEVMGAQEVVVDRLSTLRSSNAEFLAVSDAVVREGSHS